MSDDKSKAEKTEELLRLIEWGYAHGFPRSLEEAMEMDEAEKLKGHNND